jgi:hypothetical protein
MAIHQRGFVSATVREHQAVRERRQETLADCATTAFVDSSAPRRSARSHHGLNSPHLAVLQRRAPDRLPGMRQTDRIGEQYRLSSALTAAACLSGSGLRRHRFRLAMPCQAAQQRDQPGSALV